MSDVKLLDGIRVIEISSSSKGAYCGRELSCLGAELIKLEPVEGDPMRKIGPFFGDDPGIEKSLPFLYYNSGKKGITLNLESKTGRDIFYRLVEYADVVILDLPPSRATALALNYAELSPINPRLIVVYLSDYGKTGPYADYTLSDIIAQAIGGYMYLTGHTNREPLKFGVELTQVYTGAMATAATIAAILAREHIQEGQEVEVTTMECMAQSQFWMLIQYAYFGGIRVRPGKIPRGDFQDRVFKAKDGYFSPYFYGYFDWNLVAALTGNAALADDKFSSFSGRIAHMSELLPLMEESLQNKSKQALFEESQQLGLPFGMVQDVADLADCPQLTARDYFTKTAHPVLGEITTPTSPFMYKGSRLGVQTPAPLIGEHNSAVYGKLLGYNTEQIRFLREQGVI